LIGHDIADNLSTLTTILENFLPETDALAFQATGQTGELANRLRDELLARAALLGSHKKSRPATNMPQSPADNEQADVAFADAWKKWLGKTDKLNDLGKTPGYRGLKVSPLVETPVNCPTQLVIAKFRETIDIIDCRDPHRLRSLVAFESYRRRVAKLQDRSNCDR